MVYWNYLIISKEYHYNNKAYYETHQHHFCENIWKCPVCGELKKNYQHVCMNTANGYKWCTNCNKEVKIDHECFKKEDKKKKKEALFNALSVLKKIQDVTIAIQ